MMSSIAPDQQLKPLRESLYELHRQLLYLLKKDRERVSGSVLAPAEWFQTLISKPEYQWVKPLNALLSDLDALSEASRIADQDLTVLRNELENLFFRENHDSDSFNFHYRQIFSHSPDVMLLHGRLREALSKLAVEKGGVEAESARGGGGARTQATVLNADEIRRSWHKLSATKKKLLN